MCKRILSASGSVQEGIPSPEVHFCPGINILLGQNAEDVVLALAARKTNDFQKLRVWKDRENAHILNGTELPAGTSGASRLLLEKLDATLAQKDGRPLFVCNFLERLDEAVDLRPIFEAMNATGRQVFIAVPHYYESKILEELPYDTAIHSL